MTKSIFIAIAVIVSIFLPSHSQAQILTEESLYHRCYAHLTNEDVNVDNDPRLAQIKAKTKTALQACTDVLNSAILSGSGGTSLSNTADPLSKSDLRNLHRLHSSWFYNKDFPNIRQEGFTLDNQDLYDTTTPALYYTQALFAQNLTDTTYKNIVMSNVNLRPLRTDNDPAKGAATDRTKADFIFKEAFRMAPRGDLIGVTTQGPEIKTWDAEVRAAGSRFGAGSAEIYLYLGGGFLGSTSYMLLNPPPHAAAAPKTNGGVYVHRIWAKAVFHDLMCRDLPLIRESDAQPYVSATSTIPFRTTSGCVRCHASQDQLAGTLRNVYYNYGGVGDRSGYGVRIRGGNFPAVYPTNQAAVTPDWPMNAPDPNYFARPTTGRILYRDYQGALVDLPISSVSDAGAKLANLEDMYVCAAKRYYKYFTGYDVDLSDIYDTTRNIKLNTQEQKHRDLVISLGKKLKDTQNARQLLIDIMSLPHYRKVDFGYSGGL